MTLFPHRYILGSRYRTMISDVQLALFVNILGILVFVLVVLYHYVAANNPKKMK